MSNDKFEDVFNVCGECTEDLSCLYTGRCPFGRRFDSIPVSGRNDLCVYEDEDEDVE